jgi:hypothetical protein
MAATGVELGRDPKAEARSAKEGDDIRISQDIPLQFMPERNQLALLGSHSATTGNGRCKKRYQGCGTLLCPGPGSIPGSSDMIQPTTKCQQLTTMKIVHDHISFRSGGQRSRGEKKGQRQDKQGTSPVFPEYTTRQGSTDISKGAIALKPQRGSPLRFFF